MIDLEISDITVGSGTLEGDGAFDIFMQAAMVHLRKEYADGRISGDKYADAYIAIMNNVLNTAAQFAVNKVNIANQREMNQEQKNLLIAQTAAVYKDIEVADEQIKRTQEEVLSIIQGRLLVDVQIEQAEASVLMVKEQTKQVTANTVLVTENTKLAVQNTALTEQKIVTEKAQTADNINGTDVTGSIGKQKAVYDAQIKGFTTDGLHKTAKLLVDTWSVRESATDAGTGANPQNKLEDSNVGVLVKALATQVGATVP